MTPEEHIEQAEFLLAVVRKHGIHVKPVTVKAAEVHVLIAEYKQKYPPEVGRPLPVRESGRMHSHFATIVCYPGCPAFGTDSTNYPRPIPDNPQA